MKNRTWIVDVAYPTGGGYVRVAATTHVSAMDAKTAASVGFSHLTGSNFVAMSDEHYRSNVRDFYIQSPYVTTTPDGREFQTFAGYGAVGELLNIRVCEVAHD